MQHVEFEVRIKVLGFIATANTTPTSLERDKKTTAPIY